jgi:putative redox protein
LVWVLHFYTFSDRNVEQAVQLSEEKYCSGAATVRATAEITTTYEILQAEAEVELIAQ